MIKMLLANFAREMSAGVEENTCEMNGIYCKGGIISEGVYRLIIEAKGIGDEV